MPSEGGRGRASRAGATRGNSIADNSNTQYALLGLYAAKQAGAKIDDSVWTPFRTYYKSTQHSALRYVRLLAVLQRRRFASKGEGRASA